MHDARHSGTSTAVGPRTGTIRWQRDLGATATPGPVIGIDGSVIVATNDGTLSALDPTDGSTRWTFDGGSGYGSDLSTGAAVLADGTIAWPGPAGPLYGIDSTGQQSCTVKLGGFVLSPAVQRQVHRLRPGLIPLQHSPPIGDCVARTRRKPSVLDQMLDLVGLTDSVARVPRLASSVFRRRDCRHGR